MRVLYLYFALMLICSVTYAEEIDINFDRVALLVPDPENRDELSSRLAMHFTLPEDIDINQIVYSEMHIPFDFTNVEIEGIPILEFKAHNIFTDWSEEDANWHNPWTVPGGDIDTLNYYSYSIMMEGETGVFIDITKFIRSVIEDGLDNYGLMFIPKKRDLRVYHVNRNIVNFIRNSAQLRVVYK